MGRAGCSDKCACHWKPGNEAVEITQPDADTVQIGLNLAGPWTGVCDQAGGCAPVWAGSGTKSSGGSPAKWQLGVSSRDGNSLTFGPDGGLLKPGTPPEPSPACTVTLGQLPLGKTAGGPGLIVGRSGYGENVMPWNLAKSVRGAVDDGLEAVHIDVSGLGDGTSVLCPYYRFGLSADPKPANSSVPGAGQSWTASADRFTGYRYEELTLAQWRQLNITKDGVPWLNDSWPSWFGGGEFFQTGGETVDDMLDEVGGRLAVFYRLPRNNTTTSPASDTFTGTVDPTHLAANKALLPTLQRQCVRQSSVVLANGQYQDVTTARFPGESADTTGWAAANYARGVWLADQADITANPPAQLVRAGVTWVFVPVNPTGAPGGYVYGSSAAPYVAAGLQVVYHGLNRRVNEPTERTYAVRGVCVTDPMYYGYRTPVRQKDTWPISLSGAGGSVAYMSGQLHDGFSTYDYRPFWLRGQGSRNGAGNFDGGWKLPTPLVNGASFASSVVLGWACPLPNPQSWMATWWMRFDQFSANSADFGGLVWSLRDDSRVREDQIPPNYGLVGCRQNGEMFSTWRQNGVAGSYQSTQAGALQQNTWYKFKLSVAAGSVQFSMYDTSSPGAVPRYRAVLNDDTVPHRYTYVAITQSGSTNGTPGVSFRKMRFNLGDGNPWYL